MSEDDQSRASANYGASYERLVEIKRLYDPENRFRANQNIKP
jgi:FAD/FMN-containing dehydrogenase